MLRQHIEGLFQPGMTWENHGEWHVDHIKPVMVYLRGGITDPRIISTLTNLQPLWAAENLSKKDTWKGD